MVRLTSFALLVAFVATAVHAASSADLAAKREKALSQLTPGVRKYLATLDESEYELDLDGFDEDEAEREAAANGLQARAAAKPLQDPTSGVWYGCKNQQYAISYDDGAYDWRQNLIDLWNPSGHKVTFFVNGFNYACGYDAKYVSLNRKALSAGNLVAAHSWGHYDFSANTTTNEVIDRQVELLEEMLLKTVGIIPRYMRFPYGAFSAETAQYIRNKYGYRLIQWSDDSGDSSGKPPSYSIAMYNGFKKGEQHLVLNHETHNTSVFEVAPAAKKQLDKLGVKSVTADKCIGATTSPYKVKTNPQKRDATWTCEGKPRPGQPN